MQFTKTALFALLSFAVANPLPAEGTSETTELQLAANCNHSIGNCYDNDCDGNPTTLVCLGGPFIGCPCGYNCNGKGPCDYNGCDGVNGRCTANYLGCACH
ncbi:uncharacterized protein E0L32_003813 [Thyridium curvatum]|uniref:Uncharacterized protein n=1 Tax=Thyridium curvatum TaxID=1093900 RepID=A0A507BGR2_9PEZI|nr:uncharacterized protein E0L32_003813 [Thyridium curvatum]TPX16519.1 hypothetical protein E0L32_003813 [Thyridium curvatum]